MLTKREQQMSFEDFEKEMNKDINKDFQRKIKAKGLDVGNIDGYIGNKTRSQIPAYTKMEELGQDKPLASSSGNTLYGQKAIDAVEALEGPLSPEQREIVIEEGYVPAVYLDTKGIPTYGVGQTGDYMHKGFKESFAAHEDKVREEIDDYDNLPSYMKAALNSAAYRGDLVSKSGNSLEWTKLFNQGKYQEAAAEFMDHEEYKKLLKTDPNNGIVRRLEKIAESIAEYDYDVNPPKKEKEEVVSIDAEESLLDQFGSSLRNLLK